MWAVGVVVYALLSGTLPFVGDYDDLRDTYRRIVECELEFEGEAWETKSVHVVEFITKLLSIQPEMRLTAGMALHHPWMASLEFM